jgi:SsrA-binding protein
LIPFHKRGWSNRSCRVFYFILTLPEPEHNSPTTMDTKEILNRKARHEFEIIDTYEAGIALRGTEVKSLRQGKASLLGAFGKIHQNELWLIGAHIDEYLQGNRFNHDPIRFRKLLVHRAELEKLQQLTHTKGYTLVPLKIYFNNRGIAKVLLGVGRGKTVGDQRENIKKRDAEREMRQAMKRRR